MAHGKKVYVFAYGADATEASDRLYMLKQAFKVSVVPGELRGVHGAIISAPIEAIVPTSPVPASTFRAEELWAKTLQLHLGYEISRLVFPSYAEKLKGDPTFMGNKLFELK